MFNANICHGASCTCTIQQSVDSKIPARHDDTGVHYFCSDKCARNWLPTKTPLSPADFEGLKALAAFDNMQ